MTPRNPNTIIAALIALGLGGSAAAFGQRMYWNSNGNGLDEIQRADLNGANIETIVPGLDAPQGIAIDHRDRRVYWTEGDRIERTDLHGMKGQTVLSGLTLPRGIALDLNNQKMYWADTFDGILRADMNGANVQVLVAGFAGATAVALDRGAGKIYWSDLNADLIQRADLNGANVETVLAVNANGIAFDFVAGMMYWTVGSTIQRADLNGQNIETIVSGLTGARGIALDPRERHIYWVDIIENTIQRADLDGANVTTLVSGLDAPLGIALRLFGLKGDMNCDNAINGADIDPFFLGLVNPVAYVQQFGNCDIFNGDMNGDMAFNAGDIDPFFRCLGHGNCP